MGRRTIVAIGMLTATVFGVAALVGVGAPAAQSTGTNATNSSNVDLRVDNAAAAQGQGVDARIAELKEKLKKAKERVANRSAEATAAENEAAQAEQKAAKLADESAKANTKAVDKEAQATQLEAEAADLAAKAQAARQDSNQHPKNKQKEREAANKTERAAAAGADAAQKRSRAGELRQEANQAANQAAEAAQKAANKRQKATEARASVDQAAATEADFAAKLAAAQQEKKDKKKPKPKPTSPPKTTEPGKSTGRNILMPDPDTMFDGGTFYTYTTSATQPNGCQKLGGKRLSIPVQADNTSGQPAVHECASGDAMPSGAGSWAEGALWAPSVVKFNGRYVLLYTASRRGSIVGEGKGQKCIGVAESASPTGPFTGQRQLVCPPQGWVIDPDGYVNGENQLMMVYRDDTIPGSGSAIVAARINDDLSGIGKKEVLITSSDLSWDDNGAINPNIIENPSVVRVNGRFLVSFSGNSWQTKNYSTGLLDCGDKLFQGGCKSLTGPNRAYFGFAGSTANPVQSMPWDDKGAAGMSLFKDGEDRLHAVYHYLTGKDSDRRARMAGVEVTDNGGYRLVKGNPASAKPTPTPNPTPEPTPPPTTNPQAPSCGTADSVRYRVVTSNVQSTPLLPGDQAQADITEVAKLDADVIFRQEITPTAYKRAVVNTKDSAKSGKWMNFHAAKTEVPISIRVGGDSPWEIVSTGDMAQHRIKLNDGIAKLTPNRWLTWVVARNIKTGTKTVFMNTHWVNGAWNGKKPDSEEQRQKLWNKAFTDSKRKIEEFNKQGLTVVYGGDFNRQNMAPLADTDTRVAAGGIDYIGVVRVKGQKVSNTDVKTVDVHSDHDAKVATFSVSCK